MNFYIPDNWTEINKLEYDKYSIVNSDEAKCIGAYKITNDEKPIIASYYYMGEADNKTLDLIQFKYVQTQKMNELIDGDENSEDYEDTSLMKLICYKRYSHSEKNYFMLIAKFHLGDQQYSSAFQVYFVSNSRLYMCQVPIEDSNPSLSKEYLEKNQVIAQLLKSIL